MHEVDKKACNVQREIGIERDRKEREESLQKKKSRTQQGKSSWLGNAYMIIEENKGGRKVSLPLYSMVYTHF